MRSCSPWSVLQWPAGTQGVGQAVGTMSAGGGEAFSAELATECHCHSMAACVTSVCPVDMVALTFLVYMYAYPSCLVRWASPWAPCSSGPWLIPGVSPSYIPGWIQTLCVTKDNFELLLACLQPRVLGLYVCSIMPDSCDVWIKSRASCTKQAHSQPRSPQSPASASVFQGVSDGSRF